MKFLHYLVAASALSLSACSSNTVKDTLGLNRSTPDEFRVVSRPPLSVPPQFALRPPSTGEESPNQQAAAKQAKSLLTGNGKANDDSTDADTAVAPVVTESTGSHDKAEAEFLKQAGADKANPKVREVLTQEKYAVQDKQESGSWWDALDVSNEKKDPMVDAKKESERIHKTQEEGQPVTTGDTPEAKAKDTGLLGRVLGY